jgi:hypothetical protein
MTLRSPIRPRFGSKAHPRAPRPPARPRLEALEDRLAPAVQLTYGGPGTALGLQVLVSGATQAVTVSESAPNQFRIDLGGGAGEPPLEPRLDEGEGPGLRRVLRARPENRMTKQVAQQVTAACARIVVRA